MFTEPLSAHEYQLLVEHRHRGADRRGPAGGWALMDTAGRVHGWHPIDRADLHWASADDAFKAFIPDTRRRNFLTTLGWQVIADPHHEQLLVLLRTTRGEPPAAPKPAEPLDDALALFEPNPTD